MGQFQRYAPAREYIVESLAELATGKGGRDSPGDAFISEELKVKELKQIIRRSAFVCSRARSLKEILSMPSTRTVSATLRATRR